ncbi:pelargonidin 3-O-(6-caffeoylglucoside) 5-O-(6-O-malonylglucoside) 4'''-malonyltransferase-like [Impatiens glandulifera]|uniref:pelargonidin 3-O-(6-caffeoylglucoside) 5-O-(6-O-malonylglucoside) 4'''-malonyltransferase-like n=1 Tax=Impatiens glandulifera TaxID=253017 RepID=UPI001FB0E63B|nr:pelargonidin 3-O-(6-caffeoylglucoside) 5-O-(6-O-malonylglucoside) 4'''-malonyltransferase-like [Impatiens glandulifera]
MAATKKKIPTVEIISKEMIKPSLPTPSHLRTYQISSLDQLVDLSYIRVVFFYNRPLAGETNDVIQVLKSSLSETLTHYYPLAGKFVEEDALIDCDDSGAEFTTAVIVGGEDGEFLDAIENPDMGFLEKLVSKEHNLTKKEDEILAVQITRFPSGEVTVGVCICHKISDAATLSSFLKLWSAAARILISGESSFKELIPLGPVFDAPRIWPSVPGLTRPSFNFKEQKMIVKKFVFNPSSLTRLKEELSGGDIVPTRVTSLTALIWHTIMNCSSGPPTKHILVLPADIRKRMSPPLPSNTLGNITKVATVDVVAPPLTVEVRVVLGLIKEAIGKMDEEYGKKKGLQISKEISFPSKLNMTIIISWCWLPFYEVDLGLGRPIWMTSLRGRSIFNDILLLDGQNGGIEALIGLNAETMDKFEKNPTLLSFCDHITTLHMGD